MTARVLAIGMLFVFAITAPALALHDLNVTITVDNAYGFGFGPASGMETYYGGIRNATCAADVFQYPPDYFSNYTVNDDYTLNGEVGAEIYLVEQPKLTDYVYIVAWCDDSTTEGALAGFHFVPEALLTGRPEWEVFATGIPKNAGVVGDTLKASDLGLINAQIQIANNNGGDAGTTSIGWVDEDGLLPNGAAGRGELAIGPFNVAGALGQPHVNGISSGARYMWYKSNPNDTNNPFYASSLSLSSVFGYLIFRFQVANVPEPSSLMLLGVGLVGLVACARRRRK